MQIRMENKCKIKLIIRKIKNLINSKLMKKLSIMLT